MDQCPHCDNSLAPGETQCPRCRRFLLHRLIENLRNPDPKVRARAAHEFVFVTAKEKSVRALASVLNDPAPEVRREAGVNLFIAGAEAKHVVPELVAALDHADVFVRRTAAAALAMVGPEARDALPKLRQLTDVKDDKLRAWVAEAIARIGAEPSG